MTASQTSTRTILQIALCGTLLIICSQIVIPTPIPFTMQTFAVVLTGLLLGPGGGTTSVLIYILLGIIGIPVFSAFRSGAATIFSASGGYIIGFILLGFFSGLAKNFEKKHFPCFALILSGLFSCYAFGTVWYEIFYASVESVGAILSVCVIPYILPDIAKIILAAYVSQKIKARLSR